MEEQIREILRSDMGDNEKARALTELNKNKMTNLLMNISDNDPEFLMEHSEDDDGGEGAFREIVDDNIDDI